MTALRDVYTFRHDTGQFRYPLFWGSVAGLATYGALVTHGPAQWAIIAGAGATLLGSLWRVYEADRQTRPQPVKVVEPPATVRPMEVTRDNPGGRTITVGGKSLPAALIQRIGSEAERNGGKVTRDVLKRARAPRDLYQDTGAFQQEWQRLGYVIPWENTVRLTQRGREFTRNPTAPPRKSVRELERV